MARVIGYPGSQEAKIGIGYVLIAAIAGFALAGYLWHLASAGHAIAAALSVPIALLLAYRMDRKSPEPVFNTLKEAMSYLRGSEGEHRTAGVLDRLPDDYVVFHAVCFQDVRESENPWNIDHVVVGPTGVFVIETKNYSRARMGSVASDKGVRHDVEQVRRNSRDLKARLITWSGGKLSHVWVEAVLVYTQDGAWTEKLKEGTTDVIPLRMIEEQILHRRGRALDAESIFSIARVLFRQCRDDVQAVHHDVMREVEQDWARKRRAAREPGGALPSVCPKCGAAVVRRVAGKGPRAGKAFLGCSAWSKTRCDFTLNLDE